MRLEEMGVIHQGKLLLVVKSNEIVNSPFDRSLIGCFFTAIQDFNHKLYSQEIEILSGKNYCVLFYFQSLALELFNNSLTQSDNAKLEDYLLGYVVIKNNRKNLEAYSRKKILPLLKKIMLRFKYQYYGSDFIELSAFKEFEEIIVEEFKRRDFQFSSKK